MLTTGVPRFDAVLGGGLAPGGILLLVGGPGSGKTTLGLQTCFHVAAQGGQVAFVTTFSEAPERLLGHVEGFSFYDEDLVGTRVHVRSLHSFGEEDLLELGDALVATVEAHDAKLLVFDGIGSIRDLQVDELEIRRFISGLGARMGTLGAAVIMTSSVLGGEGRHLPELTMADGIVVVGHETVADRTSRTLQVQKMRGRAHLLGRHSMRIDGDGVSVFPRVESMVKRGDVGLSDRRKSLGLDSLDVLMDGGAPERSLTMVAGGPATGKTLVGLRFVAEGCRHGEKAVVVSFRENPRQLVDKAESLDVGLGQPVREGQVRILYYPPVELDADAVALEIREAVEAIDAERLLIDTIDDLDAGIPHADRRRGFMASLALLLQQMEVTALAILQVPQLAGPELDVGNSPIAVFAENLILMRNVEYQGRLLRILSVVKMRDSAYDSTVRQYRITERGLEVLAPEDTEAGLLVGISGLPSEARVKRQGPGDEA